MSLSTTRLACSIAAVSFATLAIELTLTRIFAYQLEQEMVPLAIAIPFLGFGYAGAALHLFVDRTGEATGEKTRRLAFFSALAFGLSTIVILGVTGRFAIDVEGDPWLVLGYIALMTVPFVFAGLTISLILRHAGASVGLVYGVDLVAATLACVFAVVLLPHFGGPGLVFVAAAMAALGAVPLAGRKTERLLSVSVTAACAVIAGAQIGASPLDITPAPRKWVAKVDAIETSVWDPVARLDVSGVVPTRPSFGGVLSDTLREVVNARVVFVDGRAPSFLLEDPLKDGPPRWATAMVQAAPYQIRRDADVAVVGVGGGPDVVIALANGARNVTGIEVNRSMLALGRTYGDFTGHLLERPDVRIIASEGRAYFSATDERYDIIQLSGVDTWATVVSGANAMVESYLYTVEGVETLLDRLKPGGLLGYSRWNLFPPKETMRMVASFREVLERRGVREPARHIAVVGGGSGENRWAEILMKAEPLTDAETRALVDWARSLEFVVHYPSDEGFFTKYLTSEDPGALAASYPFAIHPVSDDRPFFFNFVRLGDVLDARYLSGSDREKGTTSVGLRFTLLTIIVVGGLSMLILATPAIAELRRRRDGDSPEATPLSYVAFVCLFVGLAFGFIFFEIGFIQRFTVLLGGPLYSLGVVLATLLLATGVGSMLSGRLPASRPRLARMAAFAAVVCAIVWVFFVVGGHNWLLPLPWGVRLACALLILVPCGVVLGTLFPLSLRILLGADSGRFTPWAWGINASFTATGASLCLVLALLIGFSGVLALAVLSYAMAAIAGGRLIRGAVPR